MNLPPDPKRGQKLRSQKVSFIRRFHCIYHDDPLPDCVNKLEETVRLLLHGYNLDNGI